MAKVVDNAQSSLVGMIKVVLLFGGLIAVVAFAKQNPDIFGAVVNKLLQTAAGLIIWVCDLIQKALPPSASTGAG